jgi:hypothetical protein
MKLNSESNINVIQKSRLKMGARHGFVMSFYISNNCCTDTVTDICSQKFSNTDFSHILFNLPLFVYALGIF